MADDDNGELPNDGGDGDLPTLRERIEQWLGFQLPSIHLRTFRLPQTFKNVDKALPQSFSQVLKMHPQEFAKARRR
jgi:hypothetical protein